MDSRNCQTVTVTPAEPGVYLFVINEVCNNLIRKAGYTEPEIQQTIQNLVAVYPILDVTLPMIRMLLRCV